MFAAFFMRSIAPLRAIAILSNAAFIAYAIGAANIPILVLHAALLPLNILRLSQHMRLARRVREALKGSPDLGRLVPLMERRTFPEGAEIFRKGDPGDAMFVLISGRISFPEIGADIGEGAIFGEMSLFSDRRERIATAICTQASEVASLSGDRVRELTLLDPGFGLYLTRLIVTRMTDNITRLSR